MAHNQRYSQVVQVTLTLFQKIFSHENFHTLQWRKCYNKLNSSLYECNLAQWDCDLMPKKSLKFWEDYENNKSFLDKRIYKHTSGVNL